MYTSLEQVQLKSGERLDIGVVSAPDQEWARQITDFLGHKGSLWLPQIIGSLEGPLDSLLTQFYVGQIGGRLACQAMLAGDRGIGLLGHVYTRPEDRRKGAIKALLGVLMQNCRRTYHTLSLGAAFERPAYWIYDSLGFRSVGPGHGEMVWHDAVPDTTFHPAPTSVRSVQWDDWSSFNLLAMQPISAGEDLPRSPLLGLKAQGSVEAEFLTFQARRTADTRIQAAALASETGATVGWALCAPDSVWLGGMRLGDMWLLDVHTHPDFSDSLPSLLDALEWPEQPVVSYVTNSEGAKATALRGAGFQQVAWLRGWLEFEGRHDLFVMARG